MKHPLELWQRLVPQLSVVHHVHGRIRLRIAPGVLESLDDLTKMTLAQLRQTVPGIVAVDVNPLTRSLTVHYDKVRYSKTSMHDWAHGRLPPELESHNRQEAGS